MRANRRGKHDGENQQSNDPQKRVIPTHFFAPPALETVPAAAPGRLETGAAAGGPDRAVLTVDAPPTNVPKVTSPANAAAGAGATSASNEMTPNTIVAPTYCDGLGTAFDCPHNPPNVITAILIMKSKRTAFRPPGPEMFIGSEPVQTL